MPGLVLSVDGVVLRHEALTKDRTTVGRRTYNDIVIDHPTVSGEHAALLRDPDGVTLLDLGSTNGTFVNGRAITRHLLRDDDLFEIGKYAMRYRTRLALEPAQATIRVLSGPAAGHVMALVKPVTTLGRTGGAVASIACQPPGFLLALLSGEPAPRVNGELVGDEPVALRHGDQIEFAGTRLQFMLS